MTLDCKKMFLESDRKQQSRVISWNASPAASGKYLPGSCCGARNFLFAVRPRNFDRCHSLRSRLPPPAALPSLPARLRSGVLFLPFSGSATNCCLWGCPHGQCEPVWPAIFCTPLGPPDSFLMRKLLFIALFSIEDVLLSCVRRFVKSNATLLEKQLHREFSSRDIFWDGSLIWQLLTRCHHR